MPVPEGAFDKWEALDARLHRLTDQQLVGEWHRACKVLATCVDKVDIDTASNALAVVDAVLDERLRREAR